MDFCDALILIKKGKSLKRKDWHQNKEVYLDVTLMCRQSRRHPAIVWQPSGLDILADDWMQSKDKEQLTTVEE